MNFALNPYCKQINFLSSDSGRFKSGCMCVNLPGVSGVLKTSQKEKLFKASANSS